jgi:opacity protein-like surface antigen
MPYKKIALATALVATATLSMAADFDGPFVQAGIGFANAQTEVGAPTWFSGKLSDNSFIGQLAAGYSRSFGQFNLAANLYRFVGDQKGGKIDYGSAGIGTIQFKTTNTCGLSIDPGIAVKPATLVYVKLGYVAGKGRGSDAWTAGGAANSASFDESFHGYAYGAGIKHRLTANLYGMAEIQQTNYSGKTWTYGNGYQVSVKPSSLTGIVGIGYRF